MQAFTVNDIKQGNETESEKHLEVMSHSPTKLVDGRSEAPVIQHETVKDTLSCEKCGQVFPLDQIHLKQKHKCAGLAEPIKHVPKPVPPVVPRKPWLPRKSTKANRNAEYVYAAEDLPRCKNCGRTFPWNEVQLRWKHKCEPTDTPDKPRRRSKSSAADFESKRPPKVPSATTDELSSSFNEEQLKNETDNDPQVCGCGLTFHVRREFITHVLSCSSGTPLASPATRVPHPGMLWK